MKTAIIYYSYTGKTKKLAEKKVRKDNADLIEIKEKNRRSTVGAYVVGSLAARRQKKAEIETVFADFSDYDRLIIMVPLWAGFPAPAFNNILELIPPGKEIELIITSGSGNSSASKEKTIALSTTKKVRVVKYQDVKTSK
ncbi:flavodoxin family protein [uncultured Robinsoniella sp.]|uniref:flavodoxin family protein n=1 Tax=uncultured Robinsoniella sp. TaxID=904190 RepID=UPI00374F330D